MTDSFKDFVKRQVQIAEEEEKSIDWNKRLSEWLGHLGQLKKEICLFLEEYIAEERVNIEYKTKTISEDKIGTYNAEVMSIHIGSARIDIDPIGTNIIGARGRVDIKGPKGNVRLVLVPRDAERAKIEMKTIIYGSEGIENEDEERRPEGQNCIDWTWKLSTPPPSLRYTEFNMESFHTAIMEVVNG